MDYIINNGLVYEKSQYQFKNNLQPCVYKNPIVTLNPMLTKDRCTGKTTAHILSLLGSCLARPNKIIPIDRYDTRESNPGMLQYLDYLEEVIEKLDLKLLTIDRNHYTLYYNLFKE